MKKNYFSLEKFMLRLCGISLAGGDSIVYKIYSFFMITCFNFGYPIVASGDIFKHDFIDSARVFLYCIASLMGLIMTLAVFRNRKKLGKLLDKLEESPFVPNPERGDNAEEKLLEKWITFKTKQSITLYATAVTSIVCGFAYTLVQRIKYTDPQKWVFNYGPLTILNVTYSPNYEISLIYQSVSVLSISVHIFTVTITLASTLAFASMQFQIVQNTLRNLVEYSHQRRALQDSNVSGVSTHADESPLWTYIQSILRETISHHLKIFDLISELEDIFNISILAIYLITLGVLGFIMYITSLVHDIRTIKLITEAASISIVVLLICYWGEEMADESQNVGLAAYESNFIGTDLKFQKSLIIIMQRSQCPTRIKAGHMIETSLVTFAWILKTSYSCFMVLRSTNGE